MAAIEKKITGIYFLGKRTKVTFNERFQPKAHNEVVDEETGRKNNFTRERKFQEAMQVMAVHLLVRLGLTEPTDRLGKLITLENGDFFTDNIYLDDERYENVEITSVIITTKADYTKFKINGILTTPDNVKQKIGCPSFSTLKASDGSWNYPLIDFAQMHLETLLIRAKEHLAYNNPQMTMFDDPNKIASANLPEPEQKPKEGKKNKKADLVTA